MSKAMNKATPVLELKNISKAYKQGENKLQVLSNISLAVNKGESLGILGQSGCGKSTLLHIAGLLDNPDSGEVLINGKKCGLLSDYKRTMVRREDVGFIYQFHHLLPEFTALENIMVPQIIAGKGKAEAKKKAEGYLSDLGITARAKHRPSELSGGEQQRVAIARALANDPKIILADEPTGNLDPGTANGVFDLLLNLVDKSGLSIVIVTHNTDLVKKLDRVMSFKSGILTEK